MTYPITLTNGSTLIPGGLTDGTIDQTYTDLTLIGKNSTNFGLYINDNFVHLLENFANTSQPNHPIAGQLWFDTSTNRLMVYDGSAFKVSGGTLVATSAPSNITTGDMWIDSKNGQLYFNDGSATIKAGPLYSKLDGISGFDVQNILDVTGQKHTVVYLYIAGNLMGIFAKESFVPASSITNFTSTCVFTANQSGTSLIIQNITSGSITIGMSVTGSGVPLNTIITSFVSGTSGGAGTYTVSTSSTVATTTMTGILGTINVGFNVSTYPNIKFNVPVTQSTKMLAADGSLKSAEQFLSTDSYQNTTSGSLQINNSNPLTMGVGGYSAINVTSGTFELTGKIPNQNFQVTVGNGASYTQALFVNAANSQVGIYQTSPLTTLDVNGSFRIASGFAPATSSGAGSAGQIAWDSSYLYVCTSTNTWKRVALSSF
jgi:hypothetical protein